jgi:hypothetical protein
MLTVSSPPPLNQEWVRRFGYAMVLIVMTLSMPTRVYADGIAGLSNLRWGMTMQQVQKVYPNFEQWSEQLYDPFDRQWKMDPRYGLQHYWASCEFKLTLDFFDNQLLSVTLNHSEPVVDWCRSSLRSALVARYGERPSEDQGNGVRTISWMAGQTELTYAEHDWGKGSFVSVVYLDPVASRRSFDTILRRKANP